VVALSLLVIALGVPPIMLVFPLRWPLWGDAAARAHG